MKTVSPPTTLSRGFTLIELLIVIAIIAILAALAIPNFTEAQVRAKVSRAAADFRTVATALEAYRVDTGRYPKGNHSSRVLNPWGNRYGYKPTLERLSTPVAYLVGESAFYDPFKALWRYDGDLEERDSIDIPPGDLKNKQLYWYAARNMTGAAEWDQPNDPNPLWYYLECAGPDLAHHNAGDFLQAYARTDTTLTRSRVGKMLYDPTNGTSSRGSVWRPGGTPDGYGKTLYLMAQQKNGG